MKPHVDNAAKIQKISQTYLHENDETIENVLKMKSSNLRKFMINNPRSIFLMDFKFLHALDQQASVAYLTNTRIETLAYGDGYTGPT